LPPEFAEPIPPVSGDLKTTLRAARRRRDRAGERADRENHHVVGPSGSHFGSILSVNSFTPRPRPPSHRPPSTTDSVISLLLRFISKNVAFHDLLTRFSLSSFLVKNLFPIPIILTSFLRAPAPSRRYSAAHLRHDAVVTDILDRGSMTERLADGLLAGRPQAAVLDDHHVVFEKARGPHRPDRDSARTGVAG